ncbi:phage portal protein, partial [Oceanicella sp. SM1341]|uniref:phage portal protein n=1 Tax=Oceanicella sp. SM1341 TaxID=1548889 RepID=UPI000E4EBB95
MNLLDRLVMGVSPERGLARVQAKARAAAVMNYDAATKGRRTYGWKAPASSADTAATGSRAQLRNLARDMIRNRAFAARAQMVVTANVVGTGIMPSVVADDDATRDRVGEVIRAHLMTPAIDAYGEHALPSLQRIVMNAVFEDGEVLVLRRFRAAPFEAGLPLPFQLQVMEADHLDTSITSYGRNQVIEGVEIGPTGRITAYHLFDHHPGDAAWWARRSMTSRRVAASEVLHVRRADRSGQLRGVTWLAPVMMTLGELSDYQEAQILKQRMASLLAAVVTTEEGGASWKGAGLEELAPGAVVGLEPGQDVTFSEPPKLDGYEGFMRQGLAAVAMGIGITLESLSGDLSGVNYSSGRMGRMEMDRLIETWQQQVIIAQFCEGVARWLAEAWPLAGARSPVRALTA